MKYLLLLTLLSGCALFETPVQVTSKDCTWSKTIQFNAEIDDTRTISQITEHNKNYRANCGQQ